MRGRARAAEKSAVLRAELQEKTTAASPVWVFLPEAAHKRRTTLASASYNAVRSYFG
jgi:hypothetical protein